jgi:predicted ATPase
MLKQLRIQNFKGWKDTGTIRMAPISLIFGANSSGKSSIGQFLMMLKQTAESQDRKAIFYPGGKNSVVQLGSFREMVYQRNLANEIAFEYKWEPFQRLRFRDTVSQSNFTADTMSFNAKVKADNESDTLKIEDLNYHLNDREKPVLTVGMSPSAKKQGQYEVYSEQYSLIRNPGRVWYPSPPVRFYGFPDEVVNYYKNSEFVQDLNLAQEKLFKSICYLGPLRSKTERLYTWGGITPESVGFSGELTIAALLASKNRRISLGYKKVAKPFEQIIAASLKSMGLIDDFRVRKIAKNRQEYEVNVQTKGSKDWVDLPDVGFGISQVLPVLVQCFYAPPGSIIIMEQPEIHLHPGAQSALADVMIDVINSRENGTDRNIQLIIETHSEHFLRRLQRRIAENVVPQEKVSAYFANIEKIPPTLDPLQIDIFGNIQNWPENFFGDEMGDITEQAKAAMKTRMQQSKEKPEASK